METIQYKKRLILLLLILVTFIFAGMITSNNLDSKNKLIGEISSISGQQRMLSERIARTASFMLHHSEEHHKDSQDSCPTKIGDLEEKIIIFNNSTQQIHKNFRLLKKYYMDDPELRKTSNKFYTEIINGNLSRYEYINNFLSLAKSIGNYFTQENNHSTHWISNSVANDILKLEGYSDTIMPDIFHDATHMYVDFVKNDIVQTSKLKNILLIFFSLFSVSVVIFLFFPLYNKLHIFNKELEKQKNKHQAKEERLDLATRGSSTGIWDWNILNKTFHWNDVLKNILGLNECPNNQYDVEHFQEMIHDEDRAFFNKAIRDHLTTGKKFTKTIRVNHTDKNYIWIRVLGQALWDEDGIAYRMVGSIQDITKERLAEDQKNIFIQGIEACNIAFGIISTDDTSQKFSYVSPAMSLMSGHDKNKILNSNISIFTGPDTSMNDLDRIDSAISSNQKLSLRTLSYRQNGESFWNEITLQPIILDKTRKVHDFIVIFDDLTEKLHRDRQEIARQRNESLGALAGSVAHEINNLLMPMTMTKDILEGELKEDCDPFAHEQIDTIVDYALQAKHIVQGILTFSRKDTEDLIATNLYQELDESIQFIGNLLSNRTTLEFICNGSPEETGQIEVLINSTEMKQIITNLCKNAEDSFDGKDGNIAIFCAKETLPNNKRSMLNLVSRDFAVITVKDDGSGISDDIVDQIFDPLFTTKKVGQGTGLGLSVVHGILRSWGGAITVDSKKGKGTTFHLYIPIHHKQGDYDHLLDLIESGNDE